ncbi:hypothetical protein [Hyphomicrobium sp.]|uniref:hypothetical protein n=1 Tax=Hyphomicrobium sp. TaxID=82 RepID=UPI003F700D9D
MAVCIQMGGDRLDAHGAGDAVAIPEEPEHEPHDLGFDRIDGQVLFELRAALLDNESPVSVGRV